MLLRPLRAGGGQLGGTRSGSGDAAGANREAGKAMSSDWCGRSVLYSCAPGVQRGLQHLERLERAVHVQQLELQRLVQPLDLARGGRRPGLGQPLGDAVLPADPLEQHLGRAGLDEPAGKHRAVIGEHFLGHPVDAPSPPRKPGRPAGRWPA